MKRNDVTAKHLLSRRKYLKNLLFGCLFLLTGCLTPPTPMDCAIQSWLIKTNTTLFKRCSPYNVDGTLTISNDAVLTIEPGVTLTFATEAKLFVEQGRLLALGAADAPISLISNQASPSAGAWLGVHFGPKTAAETVLSHVVIQDAGNVCLWVEKVPKDRISITQTTLQRCKEVGIQLDVDAPLKAFTGIFFKSMRYGLALPAHAVSYITEAFSYTEVLRNKITHPEIRQSATWVSQPIPWEVVGLDIGGDPAAILTLEAGTKLLFGEDAVMDVGRVEGGEGGLIVKGTKEAPVVFASILEEPAPGQNWRGLFLGAKTVNGTTLDYAIFRHAGYNRNSVFNPFHACLWLNGTAAGRVSITNTTFESCERVGLAIDKEPPPKLLSGLTFKKMRLGMLLHPNVIGSLVDGGQYEKIVGNEVHEGHIRQSATWVKQNVPWLFVYGVHIEGSEKPILTIEAGTRLLFEQDKYIHVGEKEAGGLIVKGTKEAPVVFDSVLDQPAPGSWKALIFDSQTQSGTLLDHVLLRHAGYNHNSVGNPNATGVWINKTGNHVTIRNSTFENNLSHDIWHDCDSQPVLENNTYKSPNAIGKPPC